MPYSRPLAREKERENAEVSIKVKYQSVREMT